MTAAARSPNVPNAISMRLWPMRALGAEAETELAEWIRHWRENRPWPWVGTDLRGEFVADDALGTSHTVDLLCAVIYQTDLAQVDCSSPHPQGAGPRSWLRVQTDLPALRPLLELYQRRLLTAEIVISGLGGFRPLKGATAYRRVYR